MLSKLFDSQSSTNRTRASTSVISSHGIRRSSASPLNVTYEAGLFVTHEAGPYKRQCPLFSLHSTPEPVAP